MSFVRGDATPSTSWSPWGTEPLINWPGGADCVLRTPTNTRTRHDEGQPVLEPGLRQWKPLWIRWNRSLPSLREAVAEQVRIMVEDEEEAREWLQRLRPHIRRVYSAPEARPHSNSPPSVAWHYAWDGKTSNSCSRWRRALTCWTPGLGWRLRADTKYEQPTPIAHGSWQRTSKPPSDSGRAK